MASREIGTQGPGVEAGGTLLVDEAGTKFGTGATRSSTGHKVDYEGHLSPEVLALYGDYMHRHRVNRRTGETRASDNWQLGIPLPNYMKSLVRHLFDLWRAWRGQVTFDPDAPERSPFTLGDLLCAIIFNAMGMLHELSKQGRTDHLAHYVTPELRTELEAGKTVEIHTEYHADVTEATEAAAQVSGCCGDYVQCLRPRCENRKEKIAAERAQRAAMLGETSGGTTGKERFTPESRCFTCPQDGERNCCPGNESAHRDCIRFAADRGVDVSCYPKGGR